MSYGTTIFHTQLLMYEVIFYWGLKKEKWEEIVIEKESESNLWTQMVSNISPAQPMKMDTFERPLAGEWNRSDMMVEGGIREVEGE